MSQSRRRFIKVFIATLFLQLLLLFAGDALLTGQEEDRPIRDFLLLTAYLPFIAGMVALSGGTGEGSMIWPPFFGVIIGIFVYAGLAGSAFAKLMRRRDRNKGISNGRVAAEYSRFMTDPFKYFLTGKRSSSPTVREDVVRIPTRRDSGRAYQSNRRGRKASPVFCFYNSQQLSGNFHSRRAFT
jgi:hypothetical protein